MSTVAETMPGRLLRPDEAAEYLGISARTLWGLTNSGKIAIVRPTPRSVRYSVSDLDRFVAASRQAAINGAALEVAHAG